MAFGPVNVPGISWGDLKTVENIANAAKKAANEALKSVESFTNILYSTPIQVGGG